MGKQHGQEIKEEPIGKGHAVPTKQSIFWNTSIDLAYYPNLSLNDDLPFTGFPTMVMQILHNTLLGNYNSINVANFAIND